MKSSVKAGLAGVVEVVVELLVESVGEVGVSFEHDVRQALRTTAQAARHNRCGIARVQSNKAAKNGFYRFYGFCGFYGLDRHKTVAVSGRWGDTKNGRRLTSA